jgi:hypothetical protein
MLMTIGKEFFDLELSSLKDGLTLINKRFQDINHEISKSRDPDTDGLLDRGEYFVGLGFTVIQQHLTESLIYTGVKKSKAFDLGSKHSSGHTYIAILNACANYWKHEPEWYSSEKISKDTERTQNTINSIYDGEYPLANILALISPTDKCDLEGLLPFIKDWTKEVFALSKEKDNKRHA